MPGTPGERVMQGAALLHRAAPGWWREDDPQVIHPAILDMGDDAKSLLGQRYGSVSEGLCRLGVPDPESAAYGFTATGSADAGHLASMWVIIIGSLRAEARPGNRPPS